MFAKSIYHESSRSHRQFLAVNCAAIPEGLLKSILFGTKRGAFTGSLNKSERLRQFIPTVGLAAADIEQAARLPLLQQKDRGRRRILDIDEVAPLFAVCIVGPV